MAVKALDLAPQATANQTLKWYQTKRSQQVGVVSLAIAIAGAVTWAFLFRPFVSTDDARVAATLLRIAHQGAIGRIVKLNVEEGSQVKAGDVLLELDHRMAEAQLDKWKARVALGTSDQKRAEQLAAQNGLPPRELDRVRSELTIAKSEMALAEIALEHTYLKSPTDGVVVQKNADVGNLLEPGQAALTVADSGHAWISANIEETSVGLVKVGQKVAISVDEGLALSGTVSEVRNAVAAQFALIPSDNAAGNFTKLVQRVPIKIKLDHPAEAPLKIGASVEIKVRVR